MGKDIWLSIKPLLLVAVVLFCLPASKSLADDIIDNGDPETSSTGVWDISGASNAWDPLDPRAVSRWSRNGATYSWTFTPSATGYHDFSMWWTEWPSRSNRIPVDIEHWGGTDRILINQRKP